MRQLKEKVKKTTHFPDNIKSLRDHRTTSVTVSTVFNEKDYGFVWLSLYVKEEQTCRRPCFS